MNDYTKSILSEVEIDAIIAFNQNPILREAVRKVILMGVYSNGVMKKGNPADPLRNFALGLVSHRGEHTNEQLGASLAAMWEGVNMLELGFDQLARIKKEEPKKGKGENPAR